VLTHWHNQDSGDLFGYLLSVQVWDSEWAVPSENVWDDGWEEE